MPPGGGRRINSPRQANRPMDSGAFSRLKRALGRRGLAGTSRDFTQLSTQIGEKEGRDSNSLQVASKRVTHSRKGAPQH
jgi:hypothetical protein